MEDDVIDSQKFFERAAVNPFGGKMNQKQIDGCAAIIAAWEVSGYTDIRWLAYMLATAKWETAHTMQPIEEYGHGSGHEYGKPDPITGQTYYGRGYVQLTWKYNYKKLGDLIGVDLLNKPSLALQPDVASEIMFRGMKDGLFTGVGLPRYFKDDQDDPVNARRIINGTDHAADIAKIHAGFLVALV